MDSFIKKLNNLNVKFINNHLQSAKLTAKDYQFALDTYTRILIYLKNKNRHQEIKCKKENNNSRSYSFYTHNHPNNDKPRNKYYIPPRNNKTKQDDGPEL